ncbi:MAG: hypothetical protein FJX42_02625 [Alphaproteobacteria bacterium]|nr:hypothetical protein [Alphaproteobacteria bacterium]
MADSSAGIQARHFTARRGFIAACGFGIVGLYGLWAGYGAAPLPFLGGHGDGADDGAHGGGHGTAATLAPDEFRRLAGEFADRHRQPDGSVRPDEIKPGAETDHAAHHGGGAARAAAPDVDAPLDVYLTAFQWGFEPGVLRLAAGRAYRFRMMAVDVGHGVALQFGNASRITRLRANTLVEQAMTFARPGEILVYCTVYCGPGHARMQSRLIVERAP